MSQLSPCPFCAGKAFTVFERDSDYPDHGFAYIECRDCKARGGSVYGADHAENWQEAREKWNTRT